MFSKVKIIEIGGLAQRTNINGPSMIIIKVCVITPEANMEITHLEVVALDEDGLS